MSALGPKADICAAPGHVRFTPKSGHVQCSSVCPLWADTVEKVVSDPPKRNNRIRTARYLNRNCVRGRDFESMLRIQGRKIVFQQYRPKADIRSRQAPLADRIAVTPRGSLSLVSVRGPFSLLWPPLPCFQKRQGSFPADPTDRRGKSPTSMP